MTEIEPNAPAPTLQLGKPEDLLGVIPYLLTYRPEQSLVFLLLRGQRLVLTGRLEIPRAPEAPGPPAIAHSLRRLCADQSADSLVLVGYFADPVWGRVLLSDIDAWLDPFAVPLALVADGERWWPALCDHREPCDCAAAPGTPYDSTTSLMAAEAVAAGFTAWPNRAALAQSVAGPEEGTARSLAAAGIDAALAEVSELTLEERRDRLALLVERHCLGLGSLSDRECAELAVLVKDGSVRDIAIARMRHDDAVDHVALWRQVVARTVAPCESAPLCLLGLAAWISGNGALQMVCLERARDIEPRYSMVGLLERINAAALHPSVWPGGVA